MIMTLLGPDLKKLYSKRKNKFTFQTTMMIGIQLLERLELIHSKGVIHKDLKAGNLTIGLDDPTKIYLIDFGLSKEIRINQYGDSDEEE